MNRIARSSRVTLAVGPWLIAMAFDEEMLFRTGQVIEDAAGRFRPEVWW